jgi:ferritin-like protein
MEKQLKDKESIIAKLDNELKDINIKRDTQKKELEDRIKNDEIKHEKEITKLRSEITRMSAYSKNSFL